MIGINSVKLLGNLGADPEFRYTAGGQPVCNLRVATTELMPAKNDETEERTSWHDVVVWGRLAEDAKNLRKGAIVLVEGRLQTRSYETNGEKKYRTEVIASFLGAPLGGGEDRPRSEPQHEADREASREQRGQQRRDDRPRSGYQGRAPTRPAPSASSRAGF